MMDRKVPSAMRAENTTTTARLTVPLTRGVAPEAAAAMVRGAGVGVISE